MLSFAVLGAGDAPLAKGLLFACGSSAKQQIFDLERCL